MIALENESESRDDNYFVLKVDESTNPHGAIVKVDGGVIGNGRVFLGRAGETLYKTITVGRGPGPNDDYENIGLVWASLCQYDPSVDHTLDIYDKAYISVRFIPGVSDVAISQPRQNWIVNTESAGSDVMNITLDNFDVNFPNFGYVRLQYRPVASPTWNTLMTFYPEHLYANAEGLKENIGTRAQIIYPWKMPFEDGRFEIRAMTASVISNAGVIVGELSTFITDAVTGWKDMKRPTSLGAPSPATGILGAGDELSITFNKEIQSGMLTDNNFSISGVLNAQEIDVPNVG
jgi:hypothetical protein